MQHFKAYMMVIEPGPGAKTAWFATYATFDMACNMLDAQGVYYEACKYEQTLCSDETVADRLDYLRRKLAEEHAALSDLRYALRDPQNDHGTIRTAIRDCRRIIDSKTTEQAFWRCIEASPSARKGA